jgi:transcriptional regulator with XRE-family HTH domain
MESFGAALRRHRNERGLSLRKLAVLIPIDFGLLSKIENGLRPATPAVAAAADKALEARGALVALSRRDRAVRDRRTVPFDPMRRRSVLQGGLALAASAAVLGAVGDESPARKIGLADAAELQDNAVWLYGLDYQHGGAALWQSGRSCAASGYAMLEHGIYGDRVEERLLKATGRIQMCAGWLAFDAGRQDIARSCYTEALALARQSNDAEVETHALANLAFQSNVLGQPREAARFTEGAVRAAAKSRGTSRLAAIPELRRSMTSALSNDGKGHDAAMGKARTVLERDHDKPVEEWCAFLGPAELDGVEGTGLVELQDFKRAEPFLEKAIIGYSGRYGRNRALYRVRLARARLGAGSADGAAESAEAALGELTGQVASWRVTNELRDVAERLTPYKADPAVARFQTKFAGFMEPDAGTDS